MNFISSNLKILRKKEGAIQAEIADRLGVPVSTYASYEYGKAEPDAEVILKICGLYKIEFFVFVTTDLSKGNLNSKKAIGKNTEKGNLKGNGKGNLLTKYNIDTEGFGNTLKEPSAPYNYSKMPHVVTVDEVGIDNIIFVPVKAQGGYLMGYGDPEYIESLPSFKMPGLTNNSFRMFEVEGISMVPTLLHQDKVICEWVQNLEEIRENRVHVIVHSEGVAVKRVVNRIKERGKIYLKSDTITHRSDYPVKEIDPADIREVWYVRLKVSADLSEPSEIYTRVNDLELNQHEIMKKLNLLPPQ